MSVEDKRIILMFFGLMIAIGITVLLSPLASMLANWLVSLAWYQAGVMFVAIGIAGFIVTQTRL